MIYPLFFTNNNPSDIEFKPLEFENIKPYYMISNYGHIISIHRSGYLKPFIDKDGYFRLELCTYSGPKKFYVHRLVAYTFIPNDNPDLYNIVNHIDGNKQNPYYKNLEHCTDMQNRQHTVDTGLSAWGERNNCNIFSEDFVNILCTLFEDGYDLYQMYSIFKCSTINDRELYDLLRNLYYRNTWKRVSNNYIF